MSVDQPGEMVYMYVYQGSARRDVILCINCTRRVQKAMCMYGVIEPVEVEVEVVVEVWGESVEEEAVQLYSSDKASARRSVLGGGDR